MSNFFDHTSLIQGINESLATFRKPSQTPWGRAACAGLDGGGGVDQQAQGADCPGHCVTQRCSGCIGFHVKALQKLGATRAELEEMLAVCVYMGGASALMYTAE